MNHKQSVIAVSLCALFTLSAPVLAEEMHDADPRNTAWRVGIAADDNGEVKLAAGGGFNNLYGGEGVETQTIMLGEYFTQSEDFRFRLVNFDSRWGGVYTDLFLTDTTDMYTLGYMRPLQATNGKTMLFPSVNYTYVDFDTKQIAQNIGGTVVPGPRDEGFANGNVGQSPMDAALNSIGSSDVKAVLGGDDAHMASVNLYALQPWNDTHYTVLQFFAGSSYSGVEMEMVDLMWLQGIRSNIGDTVFNIYLEAKYTNIKFKELNNPIGDKDYTRGEEAKFSVGFEWRF